MMAVILVVSDLEEAARKEQSRNCLAFSIEENEIYMFFHDIKFYLDEIDKGCADDFLYKLEIYGTETLSKERIKNYLKLSEVMLNEKVINHFEKYKKFKGYYSCYNRPLKKEDYIKFANDLNYLCQQALEENKKIFVFGE